MGNYNQKNEVISQKYFLQWKEEIKVKLAAKGMKVPSTIIHHSVSGKESLVVRITDFEIFNLQDPWIYRIEILTVF